MFELVFLSGARAGAVIEVGNNMVIGRSPDCGLEVPDPNVSRHHAHFHFDGTQLRVVDNNSSNGTYLNEQRVSDGVLRHGDIIRFGETRIRVQRRSQVHESSSEFGHSSVFGFDDGSSQDLSRACRCPCSTPHRCRRRTPRISPSVST